MNLDLIDSTRMAGDQVPEILLSQVSSVLGKQAHAATPSFYVHTGDQTEVSEPVREVLLSCTTSTLPTESPSLSLTFCHSEGSMAVRK